MSASPSPSIQSSQTAVAHRWRITSERLAAARYRFQLLHEAEVPDIHELRRTARIIHDLELERGALGRELESSLRR